MQTYYVFTHTVKFQIFLESYNGFGVFDELWDTSPGFWTCLQKLFFVCSNLRFWTWRSFMFLVLYFDKADLSMNLFCRASGQS